MIKKLILFLMLAVFMITVYGCETVKGAFKGGIEGAKKDWANAKDTGTPLAKADEWMQKNLW